MESYATVGTIEASRDGAPIHLAVFDPTEELLWSASQAGMVYSHLLPTAEPYSAFRADEQMPVVALFPHPFGVITPNHDRVRFFSWAALRNPSGSSSALELRGRPCATGRVPEP